VHTAAETDYIDAAAKLWRQLDRYTQPGNVLAAFAANSPLDTRSRDAVARIVDLHRSRRSRQPSSRGLGSNHRYLPVELEAVDAWFRRRGYAGLEQAQTILFGQPLPRPDAVLQHLRHPLLPLHARARILEHIRAYPIYYGRRLYNQAHDQVYGALDQLVA